MGNSEQQDETQKVGRYEHVVTWELGPGGFAEYSLDSRKSTGHPPLPGLPTPLSPFSPPEPPLVLSTSHSGVA
jgi:hypothetical protein